MSKRIIQFIKGTIIKMFRITRSDVIMHETQNHLKSLFFRFEYKNDNIVEVNYGKSQRLLIRNRSSDLLVLNQVIHDKMYEPLLEMVREFYSVDEIRTIIDAGANVGFSSIYFSGIFGNAFIGAIELSKVNFEMLKLNTQINFASRYQLLNAALWSEDTLVNFSNDFRDGLEWSIRVDPITKDSSKGIQALTIKSIKEKLDIKYIDILKIDIEGSESKLFKSQDFVEELRVVKFIAIELHEEYVDKILIINQLQALGFLLRYKGETLFGVNQAAIEK